MEYRYEDLVIQATMIKQDRNNYSLFCWKGLDGYSEIKQKFKMHKKVKAHMQSSKTHKIEVYEKNYRKD